MMEMLTLQLDISADAEQRIRADAEGAGVDVETWAVRRLLDGNQLAEPRSEGTLYDRLAPYIGLVPDEGYPPTAARDASELFKEPAEGEGNLLDFLGDLVGCVGEGDPPRDYSERHSELFTEYLVQKRKDGHL
jgi:hypothetical protein